MSDNTSQIPEWARERACALVNAVDDSCFTPRECDFGPLLAFARYIADHEEAPVDPLLIEARALCAAVMDGHTGAYFREQAQVYRDGGHDDEMEVQNALSALRERGQ